MFDTGEEAFSFRVRKRGAAQSALGGLLTELERTRRLVEQRKLRSKDKIGARAKRILEKYQVGQHVSVTIDEDTFDFHVDNAKAAGEAGLRSVCLKLEKLRRLVDWGKYGGQDHIGLRVGKIIDKRKVAKHFIVDIRDDGFEFRVDDSKVSAEAALDGMYVVRTSLGAERLSADDTVRSYKSLSQVERAFRSLKTVDLKVRPIRHRLEPRVRAHIFLCKLAYYVEWHMREAWRPLTLSDEDQEAKKSRDPVAPAIRSDAALRKVHSKRLDDGSVADSFHTLLKSLSQIVRNRCRLRDALPDTPTVEIVTTPSDKQRCAYKLLKSIRP